MIKEAIVKIVNKEDLTYKEAYDVMNEIMNGETSPTQNAAFLAALSTKSARAETTDEIAGCAAAMREHALKVETDMELFEIVGTGGDNAHSFNISTTSALVAAAGGMKVAKHGNRASFFQVWDGRLSGSAGREYPAESGTVCGAVKRSRYVFLLCTEISFIHEVCRSNPQGTWIPYGIQYSGTAD